MKSRRPSTKDGESSGAAVFIAAIDEAEPQFRETLRQLALWAEKLETERIADLISNGVFRAV